MAENNPYSNPYGNPYGNPYANPYSNPYGSPYGNPYGATMDNDSGDGDGGSNINVMEWVVRFLHYWYLFALGLAIAFSLAMLKNRRWIPSYYSYGTVIIKQATGYGATSLMRGFSIDEGMSNVNNQVLTLRSYDLIGRAIDSLPFLDVEYITMGRFKTRNLYHNTPFTIETTQINERAYSILFRLDIQEDGLLTVSIDDDESENPMRVETHYGEFFETPYFAGYILPTQFLASKGRMFFRFRSRESLITEFMNRMQLNFLQQSSTVLCIGLTSETPERDCEFINKLSDIFLLQNLERKNEQAENSIRFINEQLVVLQRSLETSEGEMTAFRQENRFVDVGSYASQLMSMISGYDQQVLQLRLKETYLDYLDNYLHESIEQGTVIAPASLGLNEQMLMGLVTQLNELQIQRGELTEKNVYYAKYTKDIENVKLTLAEVLKSMRKSLEIEKQDLKERYAEVEQNIQHLPEKELQMVAIERNYRIDDNYYTFFLQKRAESEIQKASNMPDNEILDRARTTSKLVNEKVKKKTMTTFLAIGFIIPLVLIILSELLNDKVRTPKEVDKLSKFRLIGTLRHARSQNPTLVKTSPRSGYAEMLRAMRTRIEFIVGRKEKLCICVTSAESGDGKTFMSTNLAALYGMTGKKTLLIDLDVRKPNIHTKLAVDNGVGMTNYLIGECAEDELILHNENFDFDFIRAGAVPPNPGELIHSDKLHEFINKMREQYEYIVIDTSPIGQVPDALSLVADTDITIFVIRCLQTSKSFCSQALEALEEDYADKIHLVLSDIPTEGFHSGYGYGYGYGYGGRRQYGYGSRYGYGYGYGYGSKHHSSKDKQKRRMPLKQQIWLMIDDAIHRRRHNPYNYYSEDED
ncbi:MAG: polysaccharide biosynthesis tyrosine autokinase [Paludibacteraceae bacterium]|nr:polysaccharide biosynthesis tyrosine autokinase [Paludibacteraceae bacterium]